MPTIEVITSIVNGKDALVEQPKSIHPYTAFTDTPMESKTWNIKPAYDKFVDPRRNSRIHKILIHKYSNADITIWIDGNKHLLISPEDLVDMYLQDYDMAIYKHAGRDCLYDEAITCAKLKLDDPELIIEQAKYYEDNGFAKGKGLCEGGAIIRRNNKRTRDFNEAWWADYCRFSRRDQLSLMPALYKAGVNVNIINEGYMYLPDGRATRENGAMEITNHLTTEGNFNHNG